MTGDSQATGNKGHLIRGIGYAGMAILVLNSVIGAGIFQMPAEISARAGALSPWLFLVVGVLFITIILSFAELSSYFDESGGPVLFTMTAFGPLIGFSTGWIFFVSRMTAFAANATVMAIYLGAIWPWFEDGVGRTVLITFVCFILTYLNYIGVKDGVRTMGVLTFLKLAPIVLLILLSVPYVSTETLVPTELPVIDDFGATILLLVYPFVGFESATIMSGETKNTRSTLPRALVQSTIMIGILYFLVVLAYLSVLPDAGESGATLIDVGSELMGPVGVVAITLAAFFSIGGNLSSIMLAVPRVTFALAEQRLLPRWFGKVHDRYATPSNSILLLGALGLAFALSGTFAKLVAASVLTRLICYVLSIAALPRIRAQASDEDKAKAYRLKGGYIIPLVAVALCLWVGAQSSAESWLVTGSLLAVGLALYALAAKRRARWAANTD